MPTIAEADFPQHPYEPPVLALLGARDFSRAKLKPGFSLWSNHRDFTAERDALFIGYGAAGVSVRRQRVSFEAFERWSRLTGAPLDIGGLDEFAAHWRWRADHPEAATIGRLGSPGDPERNAVAAAGAQCLLIRPEVYVRWRDDYGKSRLLPPPSVDDYATHVVDCCLPSGRRPRRPAVSPS